jgi:hypothetical protein
MQGDPTSSTQKWLVYWFSLYEASHAKARNRKINHVLGIGPSAFESRAFSSEWQMNDGLSFGSERSR